jgi:hypothetical protein
VPRAGKRTIFQTNCRPPTEAGLLSQKRGGQTGEEKCREPYPRDVTAQPVNRAARLTSFLARHCLSLECGRVARRPILWATERLK